MIIETAKYLKVDEVKNGDIVKIVNEGEWVESKFENQDGSIKKQCVFKVEVFEVERKMNMNRTNREQLAKVFGHDTANWVGKQCTIEIIKVSVGGNVKPSILLNPIV